jgi:hypothetical protein
MLPNERLAQLLQSGADVVDETNRDLASAMRRGSAALLPRRGETTEAGGVWVTYYSDWSEFIIYDSEIDALREAVHGSHGDLVMYVPYGEPVRDYVGQAARLASPEQESTT